MGIWTLKQWHTVVWSNKSNIDVCVGDATKAVLYTLSEGYHTDYLVKNQVCLRLYVWKRGWRTNIY